MNDLLPCPFCGSGNHAIFPPSCKRTDPYDPSDRAYPIVRCSHCFTEVPGDDWDNSTRSAIERWNRRATAAEATVTALEEKLKAAVRPLEWKDISDERACYQATPPIGPFYWIEDDGFSEKKYGVRAHQLLIGSFDDLDAAEAAAQKDFETRIRSALIGGDA